jgi:transcriptional regulator with XRE-family HTH domain
MVLSTLAAALDGTRSPSERPVTLARMANGTLGAQLKQARMAAGLSLRDVERRTGVRSGHLSQIETDAIAKPELAILWDLADLYGIDFGGLLVLAGHGEASQPSGRQRQRMTVALRAMQELTPAEQAEALRYMAELKARRDG